MFEASDLIAAIEARFPVGESTDGRLSVTGEAYVSIGEPSGALVSAIPGTVDEGQARELAFDEETAYFSALSSFRDYAECRVGTLYWRIKPRLEWNDGRTRCAYYMRLLISDKPPIGDGVSLKSMAHPPRLIDKMATAIRDGRLSLDKKVSKDGD